MTVKEYQGGENFDLRDVLLNAHSTGLLERVAFFQHFINDLRSTDQLLYLRCTNSAADRSVDVIEENTDAAQPMVMFGSNNYLGLANHPYVKEYVKTIIDTYGIGVGGPPLLNGYSILHRTLERRLSSFKEKEDGLIFSSGYTSNLGLISALVNKRDIVIYDKFCHASLIDGMQMSKSISFPFEHNNITHLESLLREHESHTGTIYVVVEGVYSMDGDLAPLDKIVPLCKKYGAVIILDDAHGTGVFGKNGKGTSEYFGVQHEIDIIVGTFSKAFGVVGGFICASKEIINYLRYFARSYMFSASLPPPIIGAVLAGLDILEQKPEIIQKLHDNIVYAKHLFKGIGFSIPTISPIIALNAPEGMNIRKAAHHFHTKGIFVNSIEYPAVPIQQQRFRVSIMATHTKEDIENMVRCVDEVWCLYGKKETTVLNNHHAEKKYE